MFSRRLQIFLITLFLSVLSGVIYPQSLNNQWENIGLSSPSGKVIISQDDCEVLLSSVGLVVKATKTIRIEIFTLLGKPVSAQILEPGNYSFSPSKHGVYIIKTQTASCKVSL